MESVSPSIAERRVRDLVLEHARRVGEATRNMVLTVESYIYRNSGEVRMYHDRTKQMEKEADEYRRNIYEHLAKASPTLLNKEDWLRLSINLDKIADLAYAASYRASIACEKKWNPSNEVALKMRDMAEAALKLCEKLKEALFTFTFNVEKALNVCIEAEKMEEDVDRIHRDLEMAILESSFSLPVTLVLRSLCERMEEMSDLIIDAIQDLRLLASFRM